LRIGIDVDSGERSFGELVSGALKSLQNLRDVSIYLIGRSDRIRKQFADIESLSNVFLIDAREVIYMDENPLLSVKKKRDSTVVVGTRALKENLIDFFLSPGNTGATVVSSALYLGMMNHIKKPAMATFFPRMNGGETLMLDIGANPESNEENIYHNALLGLSYYSILWGKRNPSIGLLNVGSEFGKGSKNTKKAFNLLSNIDSFVGNVEGYNILNGSVDVTVCDGFTGNTLLKFAEAFKELLLYALKETFNSDKNLLKFPKNIFDTSREKKKLLLNKLKTKYFGAAPLLGVKGGVLIGHGMSSGEDIENAVYLADRLYKSNYIDSMNNFINEKVKKIKYIEKKLK
jgi:glycerol-3-phosphate acyltransferase PlsX